MNARSTRHSFIALLFALTTSIITDPLLADDSSKSQTVDERRPSTAAWVTSGSTVGRVMDAADKVRPLREGAKAPSVAVKDAEGKTVKLGELYADGPTLLVFFRGGWCMYCNQHLADLQKIRKDLDEEGARIVAISPDTPELTDREKAKKELDYLLLSDSSAEAIKSFGLAFRLDDQTSVKYREYGIDLEEWSGESHHILPAPAAYVIDRDGVIRFTHWDADYKERIDNQRLLKAVREAKIKKNGES